MPLFRSWFTKEGFSDPLCKWFKQWFPPCQKGYSTAPLFAG